jgi:hypothetical protein
MAPHWIKLTSGPLGRGVHICVADISAVEELHTGASRIHLRGGTCLQIAGDAAAILETVDTQYEALVAVTPKDGPA